MEYGFCFLFEEIGLVDVPLGVGKDVGDFGDDFGVFGSLGAGQRLGEERGVRRHQRAEL